MEKLENLGENLKAHPLQQALDFNATALYNEHYVQ
jgi:hypothetical protein